MWRLRGNKKNKKKDSSEMIESMATTDTKFDVCTNWLKVKKSWDRNTSNFFRSKLVKKQNIQYVKMYTILPTSVNRKCLFKSKIKIDRDVCKVTVGKIEKPNNTNMQNGKRIKSHSTTLLLNAKTMASENKLIIINQNHISVELQTSHKPQNFMERKILKQVIP